MTTTPAAEPLPNANPNAGPAPAADRGHAVLWASAAVLAALVLLRAGWPGAQPASAEMATKSSSYAAMTTTTDNQEFLYLIDDRSELLLVYGVDDERLELLERQNLSQVFDAARQRALSRP